MGKHKMSETLFAYFDTNKEYKFGPKTIILDLDETLVHSYEDIDFLEKYEIYSNPEVYHKFHPIGSNPIAYSVSIEPSNDPKQIWGLYRPYMYEFLTFAKGYFDNIIIWSAGVHSYVEELVRLIFLESGMIPPKLVWSRDKCSTYKNFYHKPISDLIVDISTRPFSQLKIDPNSTLILDDKEHTFIQNPQNGILIECFSPGKNRPKGIPYLEDLLDRSDNALLKLMNWLKKPEVRTSTDVRSLDKTRIFKI